MLIEPMPARAAALNAIQDHIDALAACVLRTCSAMTWRQDGSADNEFHRLIALATGNRPLLILFDALNGARRAVIWAAPRTPASPDDHHSFAEHDPIFAAISERDLDGASAAMHPHLRAVWQS